MYIESYLWDGEIIEKYFTLTGVGLYFTNKRLLIKEVYEDSLSIQEIPYENILSTNLSEEKDNSNRAGGICLLITGLFGGSFIEGFLKGLSGGNINIQIPYWIGIGLIIIGVIFLLSGEKIYYTLQFNIKNHEPFSLTGEGPDSVLEEIFKTSRDYRGKIEVKN